MISAHDDRVESAAAFALSRTDAVPRVAIVLGSGLGPLADEMDNATRIRYADVPGLPPVTVEGHAGTMVFGRIAGVAGVVLQGRYHLYEGYDAATVVLPVRVLVRAGVHTLIVTNSAGGVNRTFRPGDLMLIDDHINLLWSNPLIGPVRQGENRFPDMSEPYDATLLQLAQEEARREHIRVRRGVYCAVRGPSYETPAEIRMLERIGADAVGMSTVPEVLAARAAGVRVLGISVITNVAAGITGAPITHEDVMATGQAAAARVWRLLRGVVARLDPA